jgi:hypothetical protein
MQGLWRLCIAIKGACPVELHTRSDYADHAWLSQLEELHGLKKIMISLSALAFFRLGFENRMEARKRKFRPMWINDDERRLGSLQIM